MSNRTFQLVVPQCTVTFFEEHEEIVGSQAGDFLCVQFANIAGRAISEGQEVERIREPEIAGFTWCDHIAFIGEDGIVSEMGFRGYERRPVLNYKKKLAALVRFDSTPEQIQASVDFNNACQGLRYGWDEYIPLMLEAIEHDTFAGSWGDSVICSVHGTLLAAAQGLFPDRWASLVYPALFATWVGAEHQ